MSTAAGPRYGYEVWPTGCCLHGRSVTSIKNRLTYSPVHYFLIKVGALCIAIQLVYDLFLLPSGRLDLFLCRSSAFMAAW